MRAEVRYVRFHFQVRPGMVSTGWGPLNWLGRIVAGVLTVGLITLGFFFLTLVLALGALMVLGMVIRWWWISKKIRPTPSPEVIDIQHVVIHEDWGGRPIREPKELQGRR